MVKGMKQNAERCVYYDFSKRERKRVGRGDWGERVFGLEQRTNWVGIYRTGVRRRIFNVSPCIELDDHVVYTFRKKKHFF